MFWYVQASCLLSSLSLSLRAHTQHATKTRLLTQTMEAKWNHSKTFGNWVNTDNFQGISASCRHRAHIIRFSHFLQPLDLLRRAFSRTYNPELSKRQTRETQESLLLETCFDMCRLRAYYPLLETTSTRTSDHDEPKEMPVGRRIRGPTNQKRRKQNTNS